MDSLGVIRQHIEEEICYTQRAIEQLTEHLMTLEIALHEVDSLEENMNEKDNKLSE